MARGGGRSPFQITLRASERRWLKALTRRGTAQHRQVLRAQIVLLAAAGWTNAGIARKLGLAVNTAGKWRKRYAEQGMEGLRDRKRAGRPRGFAAAVVAEVKAIACELPATRGVPTSRWSLGELRQEVIASGLVEAVSTTTLGRWLAEDAIKPWRHHAWIFPRDPVFQAKAARVLDLYERVVDGIPLGEDEYVISADELGRTGARCQPHGWSVSPARPPNPACVSPRTGLSPSSCRRAAGWFLGPLCPWAGDAVAPVAVAADYHRARVEQRHLTLRWPPPRQVAPLQRPPCGPWMLAA
jgi:transposase